MNGHHELATMTAWRIVCVHKDIKEPIESIKPLFMIKAQTHTQALYERESILLPRPDILMCLVTQSVKYDLLKVVLEQARRVQNTIKEILLYFY